MRRTLFIAIVGLLGTGILLALGVWQTQRLQWKEAILAQIDTRLATDPVPLRAALDPMVIQFQPVTVEGRFTGEEAHVLSTASGIGAAYRVVSVFEGPMGRILVDRGVIPTEEKDTARPASADQTITGVLRFPEETDSFTPAPDLDGNIWFARDTAAMADHLGTEDVFVILTEAEDNAGIRPLPVDTGGIPNNHLQYAITWFSLALVWIVMSLYFLRRTRRTAGA
ncbi:SURF1 family protein [Pseudaestuariivita atlantica]|uniref:SURF1-like protein n=1 Tax=Pseudaestuariivita atlantica TaxID=1317121 RepID=A0A0L1JST4_9RHOB|nr:SURF1 family protein [Pseudaestuariivita atlantica]KNG94820.1 hypothetical protein ATO11_05390 [Pseudaestuariivita atlantica]